LNQIKIISGEPECTYLQSANSSLASQINMSEPSRGKGAFLCFLVKSYSVSPRKIFVDDGCFI